MYLPKVIRYNAKNPEAAERYAQIARFIGLKGQSNDELVDALIKELRAMNKSLEIPDGIKDYEGGIIDEKEFLEKLPEVAKMPLATPAPGPTRDSPIRKRWKNC